MVLPLLVPLALTHAAIHALPAVVVADDDDAADAADHAKSFSNYWTFMLAIVKWIPLHPNEFYTK